MTDAGRSSETGAPSERSRTSAVAEALIRTVDSAAVHLHAVPPSDAARPRAPGKWSNKEELGHLLDSAVNNHHRFVRAQETEHLVFPTYDQETWVTLQAYQDCDWAELIQLWRLYNHHLGRVVARIPEDRLMHRCTIGRNEPVTLAFLIEDYLAHLRHHLRLIGVP